MVFGGKRMAPHCKHGFSFSHSSTNCAWAPDSSSSIIQPADRSPHNGSTTYSPDYGQHKRRICLAWSNYQYPGCPFPNCSFEHSCAYCIHNPGVFTKDMHVKPDTIHIKPKIIPTVDQLIEGLIRLRLHWHGVYHYIVI